MNNIQTQTIPKSFTKPKIAIKVLFNTSLGFEIIQYLQYKNGIVLAFRF